MKKISLKELSVLAIIVLYALLYNVIIKVIPTNLISNLNLIFWLIITIITCFIYGFRKKNDIKTKDAIQLVLIFVITYFLIIYLLGLITGFQRSPYSRKIIMLIRNIVPFALYIFFRETTREQVLNGHDGKRSMLILVILVFALAEISVVYRFYSLSIVDEMFRLIGVVILGSLFKNILLTYSTIKYGKYPSIIYSLLLEGYLYIVPINPNLGVYLETVFQMTLPSLLSLSLDKLSQDRKELLKEKRNSRKKKIDFLFIPLLIMLFMVVALISGLFKYKMYAIASDSMNPLFYRGDAVIIEKYERQELHIGDVVAYKHDGKFIVHRITKISKYQNTYYYNTKGDNNDTEDPYDIPSSDIIGIEKVFVKYIGYPSIWISELLF